MIVIWIKSRWGCPCVCSVFTAAEILASHCVFICSQDERCQLSVAIPMLCLLLSDTREQLKTYLNSIWRSEDFSFVRFYLKYLWKCTFLLSQNSFIAEFFCCSHLSSESGIWAYFPETTGPWSDCHALHPQLVSFLLLVSSLRNFHWHLWISGFQDITQWCSEVTERSFYHPNGSWAL